MCIKQLVKVVRQGRVYFCKVSMLICTMYICQIYRKKKQKKKAVKPFVKNGLSKSATSSSTISLLFLYTYMANFAFIVIRTSYDYEVSK